MYKTYLKGHVSFPLPSTISHLYTSINVRDVTSKPVAFSDASLISGETIKTFGSNRILLTVVLKKTLTVFVKFPLKNYYTSNIKVSIKLQYLKNYSIPLKKITNLNVYVICFVSPLTNEIESGVVLSLSP